MRRSTSEESASSRQRSSVSTVWLRRWRSTSSWQESIRTDQGKTISMRAFGSVSRGCTCHWIQNWMRVHFLDLLEEGTSSRSWIKVSCHMRAKLSSWSKSLWRTLKNGFQRLLKRTGQSYRLRVVVEEPDRLDPHCLYAVGKNGHLWHLTFVCPCGCKEVQNSVESGQSIRLKAATLIRLNPAT